MRTIMALGIILSFAGPGQAQPSSAVEQRKIQSLSSDTPSVSSITLEACYALSKKNYPLIKQKGLISQSEEYSLENASKGHLPQIKLVGQASYQSEVTQIPFDPPGASIDPLSKDQYKLYAEVSQTLYDNRLVKHQKRLASSGARTEEQKVEVELYKLRERINHLFFGILMIDGQLRQTELLRSDIRAGLDQANAAVAEGTALRSSAEVLEAEMLKTDQRRIELKASRKAYLEMLGLLTGLQLDEHTLLVKPVSLLAAGEVMRPELDLFELQKQHYEIQKDILNARALPKLGLFFQGGYGRPALNMLSNEFEGYYLGGIRLTWSPSSLYTLKNEKSLLDIRKNTAEVQRETFLFNTKLDLKEQYAGIQKYRDLIQADQKIIDLRSNIQQAAKAQLANGVITTSDYLREANAESQARENLLLHEIQLLMGQYDYQVTLGNE